MAARRHSHGRRRCSLAHRCSSPNLQLAWQHHTPDPLQDINMIQAVLASLHLESKSPYTGVSGGSIWLRLDWVKWAPCEVSRGGDEGENDSWLCTFCLVL